MSQSVHEIYIPPYSSVKLIECREHFQLTPVTAVRVFFGYGKIKASEATFRTADGKMEPFWDNLGPDAEVWAVVQWFRFADGREEECPVAYLRAPSTEEDARTTMDRMIQFYNLTREDMLALTHCFEATDADYDYIDEACPNYQSQPDPAATEEYDVYQARLKVLAGLQPKTVELMRLADGIKDPAKREKIEREAVRYYFAELAHYWTEDEILAWERTNPAGTGGMCEFARVMNQPRKTIDPVNHELALNWLRRNYHLLTEQELSVSIFKRLFIWLMPGALKKRRERLGLTTRRPPGPPPKQV